MRRTPAAILPPGNATDAPNAILPELGRGKSWGRKAYEWVGFYWLLAAFAVICLSWSLPAGLLFRLLPVRIGAPLGRFVIMAGFRLFIGIMRATGLVYCDLRALDSLRDERSLVIAPNHPSLLDVVLITSRLPNVVCITKPAVWDNPLLGGGARLAAYIRNDTPLALMRRAVGAVRAGDQLLIFPEGTRSASLPVSSFKRGFAAMAKAAGAPVQVVFIESNSRFLGKGWALFRKPEFPLHYRARLGPRLDVKGSAEAFAQVLERRFRQELAESPACRPAP